MSEFTVYGIIGSPFVRAALLVLEEKGRSWTIHPLGPGAHQTPEHLKRHPFARVPAVSHGDFDLYETQAVLRYVERFYPDAPLVPKNPRQAARMDQLMGINDWYVMPQIGGPIVFQRVIGPRLGRTGDEARARDALPKAAVCVQEIDRLIDGQPFMAGQDLSLADLLLAPQFSLLSQCEEGRALLAPYPALRDWLERMEARPSMIRTTWDRLLEDQRAA